MGDMVRTWPWDAPQARKPYSLAILLFEQADKLELHPQIQVFASDLDENSIKQAREGLYPARRLKQMSTRSGLGGSSPVKEIITG